MLDIGELVEYQGQIHTIVSRMPSQNMLILSGDKDEEDPETIIAMFNEVKPLDTNWVRAIVMEPKNNEQGYLWRIFRNSNGKDIYHLTSYTEYTNTFTTPFLFNQKEIKELSAWVHDQTGNSALWEATMLVKL